MTIAPLWLALLVAASPAALAQTVTVRIDDTVIAPKTRIGVGVNGGGSWTNLVGANLVDNPCFEGPADADGLSQEGWPWAPTNAAALTASVDTATFASGRQSQRLVVTGAPVALRQGRVDLPQAPLVLQITPAGSYVIKARVKASVAGARVRLGIMAGGWTPTYGPATPVTTAWAAYSWTHVPIQNQALVGFAIEFLDNATYWVDDYIAWNANDLDPATGLSATYVSRLKDLKPATLRLGGLGINGIPLESYLFKSWNLSYGPPPFVPEMGLNTFLELCKVVGADPFLSVPPAFSDATHAALGDLTDDVVDNWFADHGNLVDYLGGDAATPYGARREADGFSRWDTQFQTIYLELGNELWGTPDGAWDMNLGSDPLLIQQERFARFNARRMTAMKARPGWRPNMRVGFCGRDPDIWIGNWAGSYNVTVVPPLKDLTDFSTIGMYYGPDGRSATDDALYGDLFAHAPWFERKTGELKAAFFAAAGNKPIETTVYEGNAVWGPYSAHLDRTVYSKEVSVGAAVSLVDAFGAGNRAGITVNNLFHFNGNVWAAVTAYPQLWRKPAFFAAKLFTTEITGNLVNCTVENGPTYTSNLPGEPPTPVIACYAYKDGATYGVLLVNRDRSQARSVTIARSLILARLVKLTAADINANNENGEAVTLVTQDLGNTPSDNHQVSVPPFSAVLLVGADPNGTRPQVTAPTALADGQVGVAYGPVSFAAAGSPTITWSVSTGALPPGLALDSATGAYRGTPTADGIYDFTVAATNVQGTGTRALRHVILRADAPPPAGAKGGCGCGAGGGRDSWAGALGWLLALAFAGRRSGPRHSGRSRRRDGRRS